MIAVQRTCRTIRDIVVGTAYLQYALHAKMNRVDDLLPLDFPYSERLKLLRSHEQSWRDLQLNLFSDCHSISGVPNLAFFTLQDSYLIYHCLSEQGRGWRYGYTDLCSAGRNKELHWVHLMMGESQYLPSEELKIVFAVDHDLVVAVRLCVLFAFSFDCKPDTRGTAVSNSSMTLASPWSSWRSLNSQQANLIHSQQHTLYHSHHFLNSSTRLRTQKSWVIMF